MLIKLLTPIKNHFLVILGDSYVHLNFLINKDFILIYMLVVGLV